jgi:CBS domain-containing protein
MPRTLVSEIMTPNPVSIEHDQTIGRAMEVMARYDIRRLPVTKGGALAGILSDRDVRQLGGRYSVKLPKSDKDDAYLQLPVEEAMTLSVITVRESQPLDEAIRLMLKNKISGLPVVGHDKKMVGMLSEQDILKLCVGLLEREADR